MNIINFFVSHSRSFAILAIFAVLYFISRLYLLSDFPIFTDEAIYVRWAQIARNDAIWRFISLTDGKQPMLIWIAMILLRFIEDPLVATRMVSVFAGFASMVGLYFVGTTLFKNSKIGILSSFLYIVYPFALVYDRMALYDSLVGAFAIWSLFFSLLLVKTLRLDVALLLGLIIGGGVLTKTNAFFSLLLVPFNILIFNFAQKDRNQKVITFGLLCLVVVILTFGYYSILRLSPFFHIISQKNSLFVFPINEWLQHPFTYFESNIKGLWDWFWRYMSIPWVILIGAAFVIKREFWREKLLLILYFVVPFIYLAFFGRTIYPRFIFFMTLPLLPLVAYSLINISTYMKRKYILYVVLVLFFILPLRADYYILNDFAHAPIPISDKTQYYTDWPSGLGVKEAIAFFEKEAEKGPIYVATEGTFGLMPYALEIYLLDNPNITIKGFWPINTEMPKEIIDVRTKYPTYFVSYQPCPSCEVAGSGPKPWPLKKVLQVAKPGGAYLTVFQVTP